MLPRGSEIRCNKYFLAVANPRQGLTAFKP